MGRGDPHPGSRRAWLLGAERLSQLRRSLEGAEVLDRLTPFAPRAPGSWQVGTVTSVKPETPRVKSFRIELPMWMAHLPGQHYDVRLTAPDGYQAQRSYSIASSPLDKGTIELTIDRLDDGEVSPYFHDVVVEGDKVELRGPFTSYFVWRGPSPGGVIGGGSGGVPPVAMLRPPRRAEAGLPVRVVYSVRTAEDVIYADELGDETALTYPREPPPDWAGHTGHIDATLVVEAQPAGATVFICGSNAFVEAAGRLALEAGADPSQILTERFG